jgi:hypothetical protein
MYIFVRQSTIHDKTKKEGIFNEISIRSKAIKIKQVTVVVANQLQVHVFYLMQQILF